MGRGHMKSKRGAISGPTKWTLVQQKLKKSHLLCLKSHWISETEKYFDRRMNNWYVLGQVQFLVLSFADHRTLKVYKMECNPANKKNVAFINFLISSIVKAN